MKDVVSECPIEEAMTLLSGRWPTLLLYFLKDGPMRFSELRRANPSISHRMLSHHLQRLAEAGVVSRTEAGGYPLRVSYQLTDAGRRLFPLIDALGAWWETLGCSGAAAAPGP